MPLFKKGPEYSYEAKYLGGHSAYPREMKVHLSLMPEALEIPEFPISIAYKDIENIQSMSQEKISAARILLTGALALAWKKKKLVMLLSYKNGMGIIQNPVFDVDKISEVQPTIYLRMNQARRS